MSALSRYDPRRSYDWNYQHAPDPVDVEQPTVPAGWRFCGLPVASPLGVPAGPLLNGRWCLYYASLGFDVLTYKTVRSQARDCYPLPNLQPVHSPPLHHGGLTLRSSEQMLGSWAVSFGMPSRPPDIWRADVERTRGQLPSGKLLVVSVVGTVQPGWGIDELAADYARCARWAVDSGADAVEANLSCPNVATCDGQLYQHPDHARLVAQAMRAAMGAVPFILKIGLVESRADAAALIGAVAGCADALSMVNCVTALVTDEASRPLFAGELRGIGGAAIRQASLGQVRMFRDAAREATWPADLIGVGGVFTADDVVEFLENGASAVQLATAAMLDPAVAITIRRALAARLSAAPGVDGASR